jgi:hypothetical protein
MPIIPVLRKLRQRNLKFQASIDFIARPCLKNTKNATLAE